MTLGGDHPSSYSAGNAAGPSTNGLGSLNAKPSTTYRPQHAERCEVCTSYLSAYNPDPYCGRPVCKATWQHTHDHNDGEPPCEDDTPELR